MIIAKFGIPLTNSTGFASTLKDIMTTPAIIKPTIKLFLGFIVV